MNKTILSLITACLLISCGDGFPKEVWKARCINSGNVTIKYIMKFDYGFKVGDTVTNEWGNYQYILLEKINPTK